MSGQRVVRIRVSAPTEENAEQWAQTIADLVTAEHGQDMRLDITISVPGPAGKPCCGMHIGHFPGCPVGRGGNG